MPINLKKITRRILKGIGFILAIPVTYIIVSVLLSMITVANDSPNAVKNNTIYLRTNGAHLDIILPKTVMTATLTHGLVTGVDDAYFAFGWGDENFYLNTPTWGDLTVSTACEALFMNSPALLHVTRYETPQANWIAIPASDDQIKKLCSYLQKTFTTDRAASKIILPNKGYSTTDDFYRATGSYSCFKTCNSWVNTGFKESGLTACYWTAFDFGLLHKYE